MTGCPSAPTRPDAEFSAESCSKKLRTARDAALYITKLPKTEHDAEEWQTAMQALILVAEHDGPPMFARIGVMRALDRDKPKVAPEVRRKRAKAYKIVR